MASSRQRFELRHFELSLRVRHLMCMRIPSIIAEAAHSLAMLGALPYFEGSSLILAPNLRQGKRFLCVLVLYG